VKAQVLFASTNVKKNLKTNIKQYE